MKTRRAAVLATSCLCFSLASLAENPFSRLGGMFHRPSPPNQNSGQVDCAQVAKNPLAGMTYDGCMQMVANKQKFDAAASDPSAARPGDEQMSCVQITAELRQQPYQKPDAAKVANGQAAVAAQREVVAKQQKEADVMRAKDQAAVNAASSADRAAELLTGGLAKPNALSKVTKELDAENEKTNQRMIEEQKPTFTNMMNSANALTADMAQQATENPRLARLMQLAQMKRCRGG